MSERRLNLCGPCIYSFEKRVQFVAHALGRKRLIIGLPDPISRIQARCLQQLPGQLFTMDNYLSLQVHSACLCNHLEEMGIDPAKLQAAAQSRGLPNKTVSLL